MTARRQLAPHRAELATRRRDVTVTRDVIRRPPTAWRDGRTCRLVASQSVCLSVCLSVCVCVSVCVWAGCWDAAVCCRCKATSARSLYWQTRFGSWPARTQPVSPARWCSSWPWPWPWPVCCALCSLPVLLLLLLLLF